MQRPDAIACGGVFRHSALAISGIFSPLSLRLGGQGGPSGHFFDLAQDLKRSVGTLNHRGNIMRYAMEICLASLLVAGGGALAADGVTSETRPITGFDQLVATSGLTVTVACGPSPALTLRGAARDLSATTVSVDGDRLRVEGTGATGNHRSVEVQITASRPLSAITIRTGVAVTVEPCAVSPDRLDLSISTGGSVQLSGRTNLLTIDASTGAEVRPPEGRRFDVDRAIVTAKMGADIRLCKVERLEGEASMGGNIEAELIASSDVHASLGGNLGTRSCGR